MTQIVGWRLTEEDKIILSIVSEESPDMDIELPIDIYKELVVSGPPSEDKEIRKIIDMIHDVIKKRMLNYDELIREIKDHNEKIGTALSALEGNVSKLEVSKWKAYLDGVGKLKGSNQELRHLIKALYQEESKLRAQLLRKLKG